MGNMPRNDQLNLGGDPGIFILRGLAFDEVCDLGSVVNWNSLSFKLFQRRIAWRVFFSFSLTPIELV